LEASFDFADVANCGIALPPDNPRALAKAIEEMAGMSQEEREELGANGRVYVEKHHDFPVLTRQLFSVIEETIQMKASKSS
jgi:glycosyltransferase involved in cell wall biosynthesis